MTRRPTIWIVDDSRTEAAITQRSLGEDFVYEYLTDGSIMVERLASAAQLPDLVLLDWVMPGMSGGEVCRFLRSRTETRELPVIIVTASRINTHDIVLGLASGANDYVPRPFAPEELRARVDAALRTKRLADFAARERQRLTTVNRLGHVLLQAMTSADAIAQQLVSALTESLCDGASVMLLPGVAPGLAVSHHRREAATAALAQISMLADPTVLAFSSHADARATLPPAYADYIGRFGLRGLAILPFPIQDPIRGVVTVTRDGQAEPFDADDIATIETCIEHASLAIERLTRFDIERAARAQLDAVLEGLPVGILATDERGELSLANSAATALIPDIRTAVTLGDVFRLPIWSAADGSPLADPAALLGGTQVQLPVNVDLRLRVPDEATPRTVGLSAVPLRDAAGAIVGSVTVLEDVSAERAIAGERDRIAKFQQEMLAIVGHDLRSPLSAVYAGVELLDVVLKAPPESPTARTLARVKSSGKRMSRIIEQLLDVTHARLGTGIPVARQPVELVALVRGVVDEQRLAHPGVAFELAEATPEVIGSWDPDRLEQVVSNLVSNAVQYGRAGAPVRVAVEASPTTAVITVENAVRDAPIPADQLPELFEPYRRGAATGKVSGLGLGLYIVKAIVTAHRGQIRAASSPEGTVFRVELPRA